MSSPISELYSNKEIFSSPVLEVSMNNLRKIRKKKKLTQQEIADIIDVSRTEARRKEQGKTVLNENEIRKLCKALDIRADYLLGLTEDNKGDV